MSPKSREDQKKVQTSSSAQMQTTVKLLRGGGGGGGGGEGRGDAVVDHNHIFGGGAVKLLGGKYPPIPPGFRHS